MYRWNSRAVIYVFIFLLAFFLSPIHGLKAQTVSENRPELVLQTGHAESFINVSAFSPDKLWLATAGSDQTIRIWQTATGRDVRILAGAQWQVLSLAFNPKGQTLAAATGSGKDRTIRIWNYVNGYLVQSISCTGFVPTVVEFSPDGKWLAAGGSDGVVKIWDTMNSKETRSLPGHSKTIFALAFSRDQRILASSSLDMTVRLWSLETGLPLRGIPIPAAPVQNMIFGTDDKQVITACSDGTVQVWSVAQGRLLSTPIHISGEVMAIAFGHNSSTILSASTDQKLRVWDLRTSQLLRTIDLSAGIHPSYFQYSGKWPVSFSSDGSLIAWGSNLTTIKITETDSGREIQSLETKIAGSSSIAFSANGRMLAVATTQNTIRLWDLLGGEQTLSLEGPKKGVTAVAFSPDGKFLAATSRDHSLRVWNTKTGAAKKLLPIPTDTFAFGVARNGQWLAVGDNSIVGKTLKTLDVMSGETLQVVPGSNSSHPVLAMCKDGDKIAAGSFLDLKLWDLTAGKEIPVPKSIYAAALAFSPDGKLLAVAEKNYKIKILDATNGTELKSLSGHGSLIHSVEFSPDGQCLASASEDNTVKLWAVNSGQELHSLTAHTGHVVTLAFSQDGRFLFSGSMDGSTRIWDPKTGDLLISLVSLRKADGWIAVTPDGLFDGTSDAMRQVSWRVNGTNEIVPLDAFFNDFYYPGVLSEIIEGNRPKASVDLATLLQLPGLRSMLSQRMATIEKRGAKTYLCFRDKPTVAPRVFSDAQPLAFDVNDLNFEEQDLVCRYRKELSGNKQYEIINASRATRDETFKPSYDGSKSETRQSTLHVQTVGISSYDVERSGFRPLPSSASGAREVEKFFINQKNSSNTPYREIRTHEGLYDGMATRDAIRKRLAEIANEVRDNDVVFLFFSGHGIVPAGQEMFYFMPVDTRGPSPMDQLETGLSTAMLAQAIREMPARRFVLIIDSCQSGGAIESLSKIGQVKAKVELRRTEIEKNNTDNKHERRVGVYIIAAATPLQEAVQNVAGGAMVRALLEALQNTQAVDGRIWVRDLVERIQQRLPEISSEIGQRHTPMITSIGLDFPIAWKQ